MSQTPYIGARAQASGRDVPPAEKSGSPWGSVQSCHTLAPGIVSVSTAGHGGIWISRGREAQIPANVRAIARQYAPAQWYEEDCDVTIVALWFAAELEPTEPKFVFHCRQYAAVDPRMRPLLEAIQALQAQRERLYAADDRAINAKDSTYVGTFGDQS